MKKTLIFALVLLVASLCLIIGADAYVSRQETAVTIEELVVYGESALANGLVFGLETEIDGHLLWDVEYAVGADEITNLGFSYHDTQQQSPPRAFDTSVDMYLDNFDFGVRARGSNLTLDYSSEYVKDVASRTADGETRTETVRVCDYYEYFPVMLSVYYSENSETGLYWASDHTGSENVVGDYFRIPVPEEMLVEVTVARSGYGAITAYSTEMAADTENQNSFYLSFNSCTAVASNALYFAFNVDTNNTVSIDLSHIKGGYGIYRLPLYPNEEAEKTVFGSDISMVYPIDYTTQRVMSLRATEDGSKLLLVTLEGGEYLLRVLDAADMSTLQTLRLMDAEAEYNYIYLNEDDGCWLYTNSDNQFSLVVDDGAGGYTASMSGDFEQLYELCDATWRNSDQAAFAYDGRRLAIVVPMTHYGPDTAVAVFVEGQLCYVGVYDYSGFTGTVVQRRDNYCMDAHFAQ